MLAIAPVPLALRKASASVRCGLWLAAGACALATPVAAGLPAAPSFARSGPAWALPSQDLAPGRTIRPQPVHGTQEAARRWILALQTHRSGLVDMTLAVEQSALEQWGLAGRMVRGLGPLEELRFRGVTPDGDDAYEADFAQGRMQLLVGPLTADGKLTRLGFGPLWSQASTAPAPQAPLYRWGPAPRDPSNVNLYGAR